MPFTEGDSHGQPHVSEVKVFQHGPVKTDGIGSGPGNLHPAEKRDGGTPPTGTKDKGITRRAFLFGSGAAAVDLAWEGTGHTGIIRGLRSLFGGGKGQEPSAAGQSTQVTQGSASKDAAATPPPTEAPTTTIPTEQQTIDKLLAQAGYPEMAGHEVLFRDVVETDHSVTHVLSFSASKESYNHEKALAIIAQDEELAVQKIAFTGTENGNSVTKQFVPYDGSGKRVHYAFMISGDQPVPQRFKNNAANFPGLKDAIDNNKSFFATLLAPGGNGSVSLHRLVAGDSTYAKQISLPGGRLMTPDEQLDLGFRAESLLRSGTLADRDQTFIEDIKNTGARVQWVAAHGLPLSTLDKKFGTPFSVGGPYVYLTKDDAVQKIYDSTAAGAIFG